jgi:hypothetical protein
MGYRLLPVVALALAGKTLTPMRLRSSPGSVTRKRAMERSQLVSSLVTWFSTLSRKSLRVARGPVGLQAVA